MVNKDTLPELSDDEFQTFMEWLDDPVKRLRVLHAIRVSLESITEEIQKNDEKKNTHKKVAHIKSTIKTM